LAPSRKAWGKEATLYELQNERKRKGNQMRGRGEYEKGFDDDYSSSAWEIRRKEPFRKSEGGGGNKDEKGALMTSVLCAGAERRKRRPALVPRQGRREKGKRRQRGKGRCHREDLPRGKEKKATDRCQPLSHYRGGKGKKKTVWSLKMLVGPRARGEGRWITPPQGRIRERDEKKNSFGARGPAERKEKRERGISSLCDSLG